MKKSLSVLQMCIRDSSNGRMSWRMARSSSIVNIFSSSSMAFAGKSLCTLIGMFDQSPFKC